MLLREEVLTFKDLENRVAWTAAHLLSTGLSAGERFASWSGKGWLACILPLAAVRAGVVHVPINPALKRSQVAHILQDCGARLLLTGNARAQSLKISDLPADCTIVDEATFAAKALSASSGEEPSSSAPDSLAAILYTSGSTGKPKGVVLSSANLWLGADSVACYTKLAADDRILAVLPLSFDYGQNQLLSAWRAGASVAPLDYLLAKDVVKAIDDFAITTLAGVPPLWVQLLETPWPDSARESLRRITNSGGALTRRLVSSLGQLLPRADIFAMYGLTEAFRSTYLDPSLINQFPDSIGSAIPHAEVLVVRPDGKETAAGEPGELVHCGPLVAQGYWNDSERTAERFKPAPSFSSYGGTAVWSGDTVVRDEAGLLSFVGRDDAMIKSSGNRISPTEIEDAAASSAVVAESVAFGVPDEALGQIVALVVRPLDTEAAGSLAEAALKSLQAALRRELPSFMQPRHILMRSSLPRNANGKLDRVAIIADALAELTP